jgi:hypothetical protein
LALGVSLLSVSAASAQSDEAKADAPTVEVPVQVFSPAPLAPPAPKDYARRPRPSHGPLIQSSPNRRRKIGARIITYVLAQRRGLIAAMKMV